MTILQKGRFFYWVVREFTQKYTKLFTVGILIGILVTVLLQFLFSTSPVLLTTKTTRIGVVGEYSVSTMPSWILAELSQGLTTLDASGSALPGIASSWEATNSGKTFIFHLKDNIQWHDKFPLTAADINYNIKNVSVVPNDAKTVTFTIDMPYSPFPVVVSRPMFKNGLTGLGAYKVYRIKLKGGAFSTLTLAPLDTAKPKKEYIFYKTETQAILGYKLGEIDQMPDVIAPDSDLRSWKNTKVTEVRNYQRMVSLFFNLKDQLLGEKQFRQALAWGIPNFGEEKAISPISKNSWAYTDTVKKYEYDEAQAKKLLEQTKVGTSSATLTINTFTPYMDMAQQIADSWTKLGVKTDVKVENSIPASYQVLLTARDIPMDPDQYAFWHSTQTQTNITGYANAKIDKLLEDGRVELDQEKRKALYVDFQKRLVDDVPAVFLFYPKTYKVERI